MENKTKRFLKVALVLMLVVAMLPQITIGAKAADTADTVTAYCEHESHNQNGICAIEGCGVAVGHTYDRATGLCDCGAEDPNYGATYVAYIGEQGYESLQAAIDAVKDGDVILSNADMSAIYVNSAYTGEIGKEVAEGLYMGINAFDNINDAAAAAEKAATKLVINSASKYTTHQYYFLNTVIDAENKRFDDVADASVTYDVDANAPFTAYQILINNAKLNVPVTGNLRSSEALRIMGGEIAVRGNRAKNAEAPTNIFTGSWGGGVTATDDTQVSAGYLQLNQETAATFGDTVILVTAGIFTVDDATVVLDNAYLYIGNCGTYTPAVLTVANGGKLALTNNASIVKDNSFVANMTVGAGAELSLDISSKLVIDTLTVAERGTVIIDATGFPEGETIKVIEQTDANAATLKSDKLIIKNLPEGTTVSYDDGDVTLVRAKAVATIGGDRYFTLQAAVDAAVDGNTITMIDNITEELVTINKAVTLNGNGYTLTGNVNLNGASLTDCTIRGQVIADGEVTLAGSNDISRLWITGDNAVATIPEGATLTVETPYPGILIVGATETDGLAKKYFTTTSTKGGKLVVNGTLNGEAVGVFGNGELVVGGEINTPELYTGKDATDTTSTAGKVTIAESGALQTIFCGLGGETNVAGTLTVKGAPGEHNFDAVMTVKSGAVLNVTGKLVSNRGIAVEENATVNVDSGAVEFKDLNGNDSKFSGKLTNNGTVTVSGESTLNIPTLSGTELKLLHGAIIKDSTVGGEAMLYGKVIFRGDNTFTMIYDYGNAHSEEYAEWIVEKGASLTLTETARYGLGYGDKATIYGEIEDALTARENLTEDDISVFMHGLVAMSNWDVENSLTVKDSYVTIGSNNSFGNSPKASHVGTFNILFENAVLDASRITFYEAPSKTNFDFVNSDVKIGTFMTRDADSKFTLTNTKLLSTATTNGTDAGNYNAGELTLVNSSLTYNAPVTNTGKINLDATSTLTAPSITGEGTIIIDATGLEEGKSAKVIDQTNGTSLEGKVEIIGENVIVTYGTDGDVTIEKAVAYIGEQGYASLQAAINAAADRDTVKLLADIDLGEATLVIDKAITLDTNDHKLTAQVVLAHEDAKFVADESMKESVSTSVTDKKVGYDNAAGIYSVVNFTVAGSNVTLGNDLALNFWVRKADLSGTGYTAEIIKGNTVEYVAMNEWTTVYDDGVAYYQIPFGGMAAKEMNDEVSVQIFKDGKAISNKFTDSVVEYAKFMFANSNDKELHTMLVDMLNYGAAAQKAFNYNTDNLANSILSEEQKKVPAANTDDMDDKWNGGKIGYGSNLELKDNIILHIWFRNANITKAVISYTDHSGKTVEVSTSSFKDRLPGISSVAVDTLVVADGNQTITVDFYSGDTKVGTVTESIESYLKYMLEKNGGNELYNATAKFVASSYDLFH